MAAILLLTLLGTDGLLAYSMLTHEEIVDLVWGDELRPLPLSGDDGRTTPKRHAVTRLGAVIQDLGYYPFGSAEFKRLSALRSKR